MAIIKCPECGNDVSTKARVCPHCGFPLEPENTSKEEQEESGNIHTNNYIFLKRIVMGSLAAILVIAILFHVTAQADQCNASGCSNTKVSKGDYCTKHTCNYYGCYNYKSPSSYYCYTHEQSNVSSKYSDYKEEAEDVLKIENVKGSSNSLYYVCTGTVRNTGKKTYKYVQVKGSFKDSSGKVKDTDWTYAVGSEGLSPGETSTFRMSTDIENRIASCSVVLLDYEVKE